jgi:four helix bundle protein
VRCERLEVWKRSSRLSVEVYRHFASSHDFGFKDQITRSSLSIASNIAEGVEKDSNKEKIRFIEMARGSVAELITQIYIGIEIDYIPRQTGLQWTKEADEISRMLVGLKRQYAKKP